MKKKFCAKRKQLLFITLFDFLFLNSFTQSTCTNAYTFQGGNNGLEIQEIDSDTLGNVFLNANYFYGGQQYNLGKAAFLMNYNFNTGLKWEKIIKSSSNEMYVSGIKADKKGNCYAGIGFLDTLQIENLPTYITKHDKGESLILKIDSQGFITRHIKIGPGGSRPSAVTNDKLFITGGLRTDSLIIGNTLLLSSNYPFYLCKLDENLNPIWAINSTPACAIWSLTNTLLCSGGFYEKDSLIINGVTYYSNNGSVLIIKADSTNGNPIDVKQVSIHHSGSGNLVSNKNNTTYLTGDLGAPITIDGFTVTPNPINDFFIFKFNASGNTEWGIRGGGANFDRLSDIQEDDEDNIYITGWYDKQLELLGASLSASGHQAFVAKISPAGNLLWIKDFQGNGESEGNAISILPNGDIYVAGVFSGDLTMDNATITGFGGFIIKISEDSLNNISTNIKNIKTDFNVYPNPSSGGIQINYSSSEKGVLQLNVIDSKGKIVFTETFQGEYNKSIDLGTKSKGVYFIEIINNEKKQVKKIVLD